jgi:hypothetical protein
VRSSDRNRRRSWHLIKYTDKNVQGYRCAVQYYVVAVVCPTGVILCLVFIQNWGMVKPHHPSNLSRSLITSCDTPVVFMLLVNVTLHLLSRRPPPILRNTRGSRTSKNTKFCLTLFISQDAIFILICVPHLILHWCAWIAEAYPLLILFIIYFVLYLTLQCHV